MTEFKICQLKMSNFDIKQRATDASHRKTNMYKIINIIIT